MKKSERFYPKKIVAPGSLQLTWTRCGKLGCPCASGRPHGPYARRVWREDGHTHRRYVRLGEIEETKTGIDAWKAAHPSRRRLLRDLRALGQRIRELGAGDDGRRAS
jgi:hypothetical protein